MEKAVPLGWAAQTFPRFIRKNYQVSGGAVRRSVSALSDRSFR